MSDDTSSQPITTNNKSFFRKVIQFLTSEPKNRGELVDILDDAQDRKLISTDTKQMIDGVLEVSEMRVRDIMIPRSQMVTIDISSDLEAFLPTILESGHSRFPVVNEDIDHVDGILLAKDLLAFSFKQDQSDFSLQDIIRPAIIVPESKKVEPLLQEFRSNRYHMAIVVDEYGGVSGVITIEDILEQIVGEIEDETDDEIEEDIKHLASNVYLVRALTELDVFNDFFGSKFNEDSAGTIGGIVLHQFNHMPEKDETVTIDGFEFKVVTADSRRVHMLQVTIPKAKAKKISQYND